MENENKEVSFGELVLKIAKPTLASDKTLQINGNFTELGSKIQLLVNQYKGVKLTEDNVAYVKTLKGMFVSLRTGIERERKEYKKAYIEPAGKLLDSMCKELLSIVDEGESALGEQLEEYDQRRKDELTVILKEYVADSVARHNLREEFASMIQLQDKYYNKTQNEEDSADDIERQAVEAEKAQIEYDTSKDLITSECEDAGFIADTYLRELQYKSVTEVLLEIKNDKKLAKELQEKAESGEKITVGKPVTEEVKEGLSKASGKEVRTRVLKVTYHAEQANLMSEFFKSNGIKFEFMKTDF
jgi:hypothetical protein